MFGELGDLYLKLLNKNLPPEKLQRRYSFTDNEEFRILAFSDPRKGQKVYWYEILMRSHLAAATAILRSRRWIDGIVLSVKAENFLAVAATLRGLIESAADASTALMNIPATFARDHSRIATAIAGKADEFFVVEGLEDSLIHYSHARKPQKGEVAPKSHRALQLREYIGILEKAEVPGVVKCYSQLCDLAHPGASSVGMWLNSESDLEFELKIGQEQTMINALLTEYEGMFAPLFMLAFNMPILTLGVLNYFPVPKFHTPQIKDSDLSDIREWRKLRKALVGGTLDLAQASD